MNLQRTAEIVNANEAMDEAADSGMNGELKGSDPNGELTAGNVLAAFGVKVHNSEVMPDEFKDFLADGMTPSVCSSG